MSIYAVKGFWMEQNPLCHYILTNFKSCGRVFIEALFFQRTLQQDVGLDQLRRTRGRALLQKLPRPQIRTQGLRFWWRRRLLEHGHRCSSPGVSQFPFNSNERAAIFRTGDGQIWGLFPYLRHSQHLRLMAGSSLPPVLVNHVRFRFGLTGCVCLLVSFVGVVPSMHDLLPFVSQLLKDSTRDWLRSPSSLAANRDPYLPSL